MNDVVHALTPFQGDLIVGGRFNQAGGQGAGRIARWDGSNWHRMGHGLYGTGPWAYPNVRALWPFTTNSLFVGGQFWLANGSNPAACIAHWDGTWDSWPLDGLVWVEAISRYNHRVVVGGTFINSQSGRTLNRIARLDPGGWAPFGTGMNSGVTALTVYDGDLIAGGGFTQAGGNSANFIARWDGADWHPVGDGLSHIVLALTVYDGELIAGGTFRGQGANALNRVASWDGTTWRRLDRGMNDTVYTLGHYRGHLIAGGWFTRAGNKTVNHIARWDGDAWHALGTGMSGGAFTRIFAVMSYDGALIAAGDFTEAGGQPANNIAAWRDCPLPTCYADCNDDGTLNIADFLCFIDEYAAAQALPPSEQIGHYANCDDATTEPILSISDFLCFIDEFAQGCP